MNEATTRLRVIDELLRDVLAWPLSETTAEVHHGGEYTDYELGSPSTEVVVEAKREGTYFTLPAGLAGRHAIDLASAMEDGPTRSAIEQVLGYCHQRGVPVGVICNGHQLLAFYASRQDGVPPLEGRALSFSSLADMLENFQLLWQHLSRDGVAQKNLQRTLFGKTYQALAPSKLSHQIQNYPGFRNRSALETDLKILGGLFILDLEDEASVSDVFVRDCYISSGALSQYALVSKEILRARYDPIAADTDVRADPARTKRGTNPQLTSDVMTAAMSRRPLILLGDVGVGKSMFLRHLIRVEAADILKDALVFYLNFGKQPALATDLEPYVMEDMVRQLQDMHGTDIYEQRFVLATYNSELNKFARSIYGKLREDDPQEYGRRELARLEELTSNRSGHLRQSLEHIRATTGRSAVVVLDNIDQRPGDFQERVFLIGQSMAESWPVTVFLALRPSTFYDSRDRGSLAAYLPRVFTVSPTRVDEVITKRLDFARKYLAEATEAGTFPQNLSLSGKDLLAYLDVLQQAFLSDDDLKSLIDNMSGGNLRLALTFLSSFVGSAYVSTSRILEVAQQSRVYNVPLHEFIRAIIFADFDYFDPRASQVCNLFDITISDGREHFLLSILLAHVQRVGETAGGDGFVTADELFSLGQGLGFRQEQVGAQLSRAVDKRLLEAPQGRGAGGPFRITTIGSYMYKSMIQQFVYVDAMIVDTPVVDVQTAVKIKDVQAIADRLDRAEVFCDYLDEQWARLAPAEDLPFDWPYCVAALRSNIEWVRVRARGGPPRPTGRPQLPKRSDRR